MSHHRRTIEIGVLIARVNYQNITGHHSPDYRQGANDLLEHILHAANSYAGYRYLNESCVPAGHKPGVVLGVTETCSFPDETRRAYFPREKYRADYEREIRKLQHDEKEQIEGLRKAG